jgi:hypothetical protein
MNYNEGAPLRNDQKAVTASKQKLYLKLKIPYPTDVTHLTELQGLFRERQKKKKPYEEGRRAVITALYGGFVVLFLF